MSLPSGIVLPGDAPLVLQQAADGLYIAVNCYVRDAGYFSPSPLYGREPAAHQLHAVPSTSLLRACPEDPS